MKSNRLAITLIILISGIVLSACAGGATAASSWPGLAVDEQAAYVAFNNHVFAIQLPSGTMRWRYPNERDNSITFYSDPVVSPDGQLIVGGYNNVLYSLNSESGTVNWEFNTASNRYIASPLVAGGNIFAPAADETLYSLDLTGEFRWEFTTEGESWARPVAGEECECIYLPSLDHSIYALNPDNGTQIWQSEKLGGAIVGEPALSEDGTLYLGTFASEVVALNATNGKILWRTSTDGWVWSGPTLVGDRLYVGDLAGNFYALTAQNGDQIWKLSTDQLDGQIVGSPLVVEDDIYIVTQDGTLFNLGSSGNVVWSRTVGGQLYTSPRISGDLILVTPTQSDELLVAFSRDGTKQWGFIPPED
jgi:outer membrane protein assembly factor BamB